MNASTEGRTLVIGVGNPDRGDDVIGLEVARQVKRAAPPSVTVIQEKGDGTLLMELWKGAGMVIVVDAAHDNKPGTVHRFDARLAPLPTQSFRCSTHAFGLAEGIELARALHQLPERLIVFGIVGKRFELGTPATAEALAAAKQVAQRILSDLRALSS